MGFYNGFNYFIWNHILGSTAGSGHRTVCHVPPFGIKQGQVKDRIMINVTRNSKQIQHCTIFNMGFYNGFNYFIWDHIPGSTAASAHHAENHVPPFEINQTGASENRIMFNEMRKSSK